MKVLIMFHIEDEKVRRIMSQDMHTEELIDQVNDAAIENDQRHEVWHFGDGSFDPEIITEHWKQLRQDVPTLGLINRL